MKKIYFILFSALVLFSCGEPNNQNDVANLSEFEMEHGIGPVTERIELGELNPELAQDGRRIFNQKCLSCHHSGRNQIGPPYEMFLANRSPEFVMNFTMNPDEMTRKHPVGIELKKQYMVQMPDQNISVDEARAIVEYLRTK